jgi:hypothetical protein
VSEVPGPTGGWAKATEATAEASKEAIQAGRDLCRFISGPAGEVVGMLWDHLKVVRFERQIRLRERVRHFLSERGMDGPTRTIALKIAFPLLENATLEEDDELQDVWARLLANGGDADSGIEIRRAFVSVLAEMTVLDVRNLALIERTRRLNTESALIGVWTTRLPHAATSFVSAELHKELPSLDVMISLSNLERLGCICRVEDARMVDLTPFGQAFVDACTYERKP